MTATARPHALALALIAALGANALTDTAFAQIAAPAFQVIALDYAPAQPTPDLDLRPGRYLLQLQGLADGGFEGLLRGPRNEIAGERIRLSASAGCAAGLPASAALTTYGLVAGPGLNVLGLTVGSATGGCELHGALPNLGLSAPEKPPQVLECDPPVEIQQIGTEDPGQTCSVEKWDPPITAPRPDLKPGRLISLAGRVFRWTDRISLSASEATGFRDGRCVFNYAYGAENIGRAHSAPTDATLVLGTRQGLQLDVRQLPGLAPGGTQRIGGQLSLPPGIWHVFAHVDSRAQVGEWDGHNNARSLVVEVSGPCTGRVSH